ncbi:MAG: hypothetical protein QXL85_04890 [Candidatus Bathyarchaeia archaeon]
MVVVDDLKAFEGEEFGKTAVNIYSINFLKNFYRESLNDFSMIILVYYNESCRENYNHSKDAKGGLKCLNGIFRMITLRSRKK